MIDERSSTAAVLTVLSLLALLGCLCSSPTPPPSDTCSSPTTGRVDTVEIVAPRIDPNAFGTTAAMEDVAPRPLKDKDPLWIVAGGQGRTDRCGSCSRGPDVPSCIAQDTQVMVAGKLAARNRDNVATYEYEAGGAHHEVDSGCPARSSIDATITSDVVGLMPSV